MAELNRSVPTQRLELVEIIQEAKHRWLRPAEICEILRNYETFELKPEPPVTPPAGSLFLFDRKALRYFRKDGHRWRKKKDGKTVKEAHEKLKAGSVDVLHCYYAHGEENENFQRRSYWMLDEKLEHIVLVHYREIKEGYKSGISRLSPSPKSQVASPLDSSTPRSIHENSPPPSFPTSPRENSSRVSWNLQPSSVYEDINSDDNPGASSFTMPPFSSSLGQPTFAACLTQPPFGSTSLSSGHLSHGVEGFKGLSTTSFGSFSPGSQFHNPAGSSSVWSSVPSSTGNENTMHNQKFYVEQPNSAEFITNMLTDARLDVDHKVPNHCTWGDRSISDTGIVLSSRRDIKVPQDNDFVLGNPEATFTSQVQKSGKDVLLCNNESAELKKLDSFGRWMDVTIGPDCDDSLMASDSENYWNTLRAGNDDKEVSSLSHHIQLDNDSLGPSLSREQLYTIYDFSPDWAYSGAGTKILIVGRFLGDKKHYAETKWGCMFGEVEVPAEVVVDNVLRCVTPLHAPGRVPFYVTCSNRLACSEVREFEYREVTSKTNSSPEDELCLQIRLGKLLNLGSQRKYLNCSTVDCDKCKLGATIYSMKVDCGQRLPGELLIQNLLAERLCQWLVSKIHEGGKGPHVLDNEGQGVIHLSASLGYQWAMGPIIAAGVGPNFRDAHGRTGLHWASCFGREETVLELIRLGASPSAVDDPTPAFPGGQTAADLASSHGHKGIAGYLAEADLTRQLFQLNIDSNVTIDKAIEAEPEAVIATDDQSMKGSLDAVRKSALAVSLIQDAFRNRAFRYRQLANSTDNITSNERGLASLGYLNKGQKFGHFEDSLHLAAKNIQKRYRGWRGRNDFLDLRNRVVKIQAHVRGHQVRKHYKKLVWSVGIVEKLILRWRRKGTGLRGFRADKAVEDASTENKKGDEYEFLDIGRKQKSDAVEKALARVKSMVRNRESREQYMRLVSKFNQLEMSGEGTSS